MVCYPSLSSDVLALSCVVCEVHLDNQPKHLQWIRDSKLGLSVCLHVSLSIHLFACLSVWMYILLSVYILQYHHITLIIALSNLLKIRQLLVMISSRHVAAVVTKQKIKFPCIGAALLQCLPRDTNDIKIDQNV